MQIPFIGVVVVVVVSHAGHVFSLVARQNYHLVYLADGGAPALPAPGGDAPRIYTRLD